MKNLSSALLFSTAVVLSLAACGPATFTRNRTVMEPFDSQELRQERDGVILEARNTRQLPPSFFANVARCNAQGQIVVDSLGNTMMDRISLARPGQIWDEISITNNTTHVIRTNGVVMRLFDPGGTQYEPLTREDLAAQLYAERPCQSTQQADYIFRAIKIFNRNIEIVPGTTSSFWVAFKPASLSMTGIWKYSVYEVPVVVDSSGKPTKTTHFDMRIVAKQVTETLVQDNPLEPAKVVSTKVDSPTQSPTPATAMPAPAAKTQPVNRSSPAIKEITPASSAPLTRDVIARAQARLKELGFNPGVPDGVPGPKTTKAIREFQGSKSLPISGEFDSATLNALGIR